jgi:OOP family OmpA-OmpF porin
MRPISLEPAQDALGCISVTKRGNSVKTSKLLLAAVSAAVLGGTVGVAAAQSSEGYWSEPAAGGAPWKNGAGQCWRAGYWSPAMATAECDPDLVKKPMAAPMAAPAPAPMAAPAPAPAPVPAAAPKPITLSSDHLFAFGKSTLSPEAKRDIDTEVIAKLRKAGTIHYVNVSGHTDLIGSQTYNQKLSEARAEAVKAYLVSQGIDGSKIETYGFGKTQPIKHGCNQKNRKALIECLAPNRRVVIEFQGTPR